MFQVTGEVQHRLVMDGMCRVQGTGGQGGNIGQAEMSVMVPAVHDGGKQREGVACLVDHQGKLLGRSNESLRIVRCEAGQIQFSASVSG